MPTQTRHVNQSPVYTFDLVRIKDDKSTGHSVVSWTVTVKDAIFEPYGDRFELSETVDAKGGIIAEARQYAYVPGYISGTLHRPGYMHYPTTVTTPNGTWVSTGASDPFSPA